MYIIRRASLDKVLNSRAVPGTGVHTVLATMLTT